MQEFSGISTATGNFDVTRDLYLGIQQMYAAAGAACIYGRGMNEMIK
jgi:hypothetical protein